jgi:hypothetical protein
MPNPTKTVAGVVSVMTDEEYAEFLADQKLSQEIQKKNDDIVAAKATARASALAKLAALGLSADEIAAL